MTVAIAVRPPARPAASPPSRLLAGLRTVLIVVRDASDSPPVPAPAAGDLDGESGRGLCIVNVLSSAWCWKAAPGGGKTVRAVLTGSRHG